MPDNLIWDTLPRLAILAGPAGIGKTQASLDEFLKLVHQTKNPLQADILYLLPSAEHRERILDLTLRKEGTGFFGERILTFNRLMQDLLKKGDFTLATDAQRHFLLSDIVTAHAGEVFSSVRDFPGFLESISDFLGELKESMVSLQDFRKAVQKLKKLHPEWTTKYKALFEIYQSYENRLETLGLRDRRDGLFLLKETQEREGLAGPKFHHIFVDGFFDFSRSQLEFLHWLAEHSQRVTLAITVERSEERKELFKIPLETIRELEKRGFRTMELKLSTHPRALSPSLVHLEKNIFTARTEPVSPSDILILEATGLRGEAEMIAREIRRFVKTLGIHFSDIAVILRQVGGYEGILRAVFREFDIPFEIHERERLRETPLARTVASFFKILLNDWQRTDLFNFLKSSYVTKDYTHICSLEMEALDRGILSGRKLWLEIEDPLLTQIASLEDRFRNARTVGEWVSLTREMLSGFGLAKIPVIYEDQTRRDFMSLHRLDNLLMEIQSTHFAEGSPEENFEHFAKEFLGLIEVDLFSLHERDKNRVQIYDISLARQKEYKVVFLAGLLEKVFPAEIREDPVFSDKERHITGLAERLPRQAVERYYFYLAVTRARQKLILSYPSFDLEGREALPSFYVDEVKALFHEPVPMRSYPVNQSLPRLEDVVEEREIEAHLVRRLFERPSGGKQDRALTVSLYNHFLERNSFRDLLGKILFEPTALIREGAVRTAFLPKGGIFKPTALEAHGRCPYRYFASDILKLEEDTEGIDPKQVGIILHEVLETYWQARKGGQKELEEVKPAQNFVRKKLEELLALTPLTGEKAYRIELKKAQMEEWLVRLVTKEIEESSPLPLSPSYFEFEFGFKPKEVGYLKLYDEFQEDLLLRGKIDRIDVDASGTHALVIDYKTGASFKKKDLEFGTALQLPLYLLAVQQHLKLKPVGGEIYQINTAERKGFYSREALNHLKSAPRSRNILEKKDFDAIFKRAVYFARKYAKGIQQADISVKPRHCDNHCPFPSVCRIEKWRRAFIYKEIRDEDRRAGII